jgi:hypothetical protein
MLNPVPMYARHVRTHIPATDQPIGFDLVDSDWVAPFGTGHDTDFIVTVTRRFNSRTDYDSSLRIHFPGENEGLQLFYADANVGSQLRSPHNAPENGCERDWYRTNAPQARMQRRPDQNYFFRVSVTKENGNIRSAM